jgi:cystathionine beta-lyase
MADTNPKNKLHFATKAIHASRKPANQHGCVNNGIYQSSTIVFNTYDEFTYADSIYYNKNRTVPDVQSYGRDGIHTMVECEKALAQMYGMNFAKVTSCGYTAVTVAINAFSKAGGHILITDGAYGPSRFFVEKTLARYGVESTFYDPHLPAEEIEKLIKPNTTLIYIESPSSLTFEVQDIAGIANIGKKHKIPVVADNTFFTSYYCNPFNLGVDVVVDSCTKFVSGHSDIMMGSVISTEQYAYDIFNSYRELGVNTTGMNAYYAMRGLRTMKTRIEAHTKGVDAVISEIKKHQKITKILHPSQEDNVGYKYYKNQYTGYTSLFTAVLDQKYNDESLAKFFNNLKLFSMGYSWGGYESLVTRVPDLAKIRKSYPYGENTAVRFYIGLEEPEDLSADIISSLNLL